MMPGGGRLGFTYLGLADTPPHRDEYLATWERQRQIHAHVVAGAAPPQVLFVEHDPVYTAGRRTQPDERPVDGTPVVDVDRGGKITYHGPGQLVGYPIVPLTRKIGPLEYVRRLEQAVMDLLALYSVETMRVDGRTGVWLAATHGRPERKICAIGIRVSKMTTLHGFALNVAAVSTGPFGSIVPCGIRDAGVTSLEDELGHAPPPLVAVAHQLEPFLTAQLAFALHVAGPQPEAAG
ncbi:MAG: lipoyl(octanoyl) transferase LipB [Propioniciclava sp.]